MYLTRNELTEMKEMYPVTYKNLMYRFKKGSRINEEEK